MRFILSIGTIVVAVAAMGHVALEWRDAAAVAALSAPPASEELPSLAREIERVQKLAAGTLGTGRPHARLGALLRRAAEEERSTGRRIELYCQALEAFGEASTREPHNATFLIGWANLRQLLGSVECPGALTRGDFKVAAEAARAADPTDTRVLYAAAQISAWAGDEAELRRLLQSFLTLKVDLRAHELEFVYARLQAAEDVSGIVPPRFPQALTWAALVRDRNPDLFAQLRQAFGQIQLAAVEESRASLDEGRIELDLHRRRLLQLLDVVATPEVQHMINRDLAEIFRRGGWGAEAEYFKARSRLFELPVVRAVLKSDTRPKTSSLRGWGFDEAVVFDEFYTSLGFFSPRGFAPRLLQIAPRGESGAIDPARLRVLVSNDNRDWIDLGDRVPFSTVSLGGRTVLVARVEGSPYRYWKLHFSSPERERTFRQSLSAILKVYGVPWNE